MLLERRIYFLHLLYLIHDDELCQSLRFVVLIADLQVSHSKKRKMNINARIVTLSSESWNTHKRLCDIHADLTVLIVDDLLVLTVDTVVQTAGKRIFVKNA
jgi:lipopolysaccharide/colanic/teichoic acid biosynthesis glycosyltransferase